MKVEIVVVDLDGTVLRTDQSISEETIDIFKQLKKDNIITVIATGRVSSESMFAKEILDIDYMITINGCIIHDCIKDRQIFEGGIDSPVAIEILDIITEYDRILPIAILDSLPHCEKKYEKYISLSTLPKEYLEEFARYINYVDNYKNFINDNNKRVNKIFIDTFSSKQTIDEINKKLSDKKSVKTVFSFENILDILPVAIDKGNAIKSLAGYLNIDKSNIMAIGDSDNDIEMLEYVGISVAMGNANDRVKAISNYIVGSNNDNGVFEAINTIVYDYPKNKI